MPKIEGDKPKRQRFKHYAIGFFNMDIAEVQTAEGKPHLSVAVDRTAKFALTQLVGEADRTTAWAFLEPLLRADPRRIQLMPKDNVVHFSGQHRNRNTAWPGKCASA